MYYQSKNIENIKVANRQARAAEKIVFKIPSKCNTEFLNSPYYLGTQLWNKLSDDVQRMNSSLRP